MKCPEGFMKGFYCGMSEKSLWIPVYFKEDEDGEGITGIGRNWFYDILLNIMLWIDVNIIGVQEFGFVVDIEEFNSKNK